MTFVLLCPRDGDDVLAAEYDDFLNFSGLDSSQLEQRTLNTPDSPLGSFEGVTGVFIGGSPFTITDPVDDGVWQESVSRRLSDFVAQAAGISAPDGDSTREALPPIFCTCYATSMLAHYLGGAVDNAYAEIPGATTVRLTAAGQADPITGGLPAEFTAMTGHKDSVSSLPRGATLLAESDTCPVQIYRIGESVWTCQFHPEMDGPRIAKRFSFYESDGYNGKDDIASVYKRFEGAETHHANSLIRRFVEYCKSR